MSITKENFFIQRPISQRSDQRWSFQTLGSQNNGTLVNEARDRHGLIFLATVILGKTLTTATLLASELKKKNVFKFDSMATVRFST